MGFALNTLKGSARAEWNENPVLHDWSLRNQKFISRTRTGRRIRRGTRLLHIHDGIFEFEVFFVG
jgi:hypothetical protein